MHTQIYATFGPACKDQNILKEMIAAGVTGMRLNLSHTTLSASDFYIRTYREEAKRQGITPKLLIDMQGPELRVGNLQTAISLKKGEDFVLGQGGVDIPKEMIPVAEMGDTILLDDGKIELEVVRAKEDVLVTRVITGGVLKAHKSIKIQGKNVKMPILTGHDIDNIKNAKEYGVTALMQPFVLCGEDVAYVRETLKQYDAQEIRIFAKIENRIGVKHLEDIIKQADVIVIARGDLGNDMPLWELPRVQKQIEQTCKKHNKPYIVVTQMLASMEQCNVPTRAEVSDIFHAVFYGAYGVMVTGETAVGKYPVEAVHYLANTAREAEEYRNIC